MDLELETQIELLRETKRKYESVLQLARGLTSHLYSLVQTQHALGDAFADLSQKSPELQVRRPRAPAAPWGAGGGGCGYPPPPPRAPQHPGEQEEEGAGTTPAPPWSTPAWCWVHRRAAGPRDRP